MKKTILLFLSVAVAGKFAAAQNFHPYDSTDNFLGRNVVRYIGQVLYLTDNNAAKANRGYQGFAKAADFNLGANGRNVFKSVDSNVPMQYVSAYDQMAGHYFLVTDVIQNPSQTFAGNAISHFLSLVDVQTGEKCFTAYNEEKSADFSRFVVVGYYEKQRSKFIGRKFIFTGKEPVAYRASAYLGLQDMDGRGRRNDIKPGAEFVCTDVAIEQANDYQVIAILENPAYGKVYTLITDLQSTSAPNAKFTTTDDIEMQTALVRAEMAKIEVERNARLQEAVQRFGEENGTLLANDEVRNGMTQDMIRWAFGTPFQISSIAENGEMVERWNYTNGRDVYFKKGVVIRHVKVEGYKSTGNTSSYLNQ